MHLSSFKAMLAAAIRAEKSKGSKHAVTPLYFSEEPASEWCTCMKIFKSMYIATRHAANLTTLKSYHRRRCIADPVLNL